MTLNDNLKGGESGEQVLVPPLFNACYVDWSEYVSLDV